MTRPHRQVDVHELAGTRRVLGVWIAWCTCNWESAGFRREETAIADLQRGHLDKQKAKR